MGGIIAYYNCSDFIDKLNLLIHDKELGSSFGNNGRQYFSSNYEWNMYKEKLIKAISSD